MNLNFEFKQTRSDNGCDRGWQGVFDKVVYEFPFCLFSLESCEGLPIVVSMGWALATETCSHPINKHWSCPLQRSQFWCAVFAGRVFSKHVAWIHWCNPLNTSMWLGLSFTPIVQMRELKANQPAWPVPNSAEVSLFRSISLDDALTSLPPWNSLIWGLTFHFWAPKLI